MVDVTSTGTDPESRSGVMDHPADALIGAPPEVDHGGHDHQFEVPRHGSPRLQQGAARRARAFIVELIVLHQALAAVAPWHGRAHLRRRTRILTGVGPMANSSR